MTISVSRDGDDVVVRIKRGGEAGGFARFLETAADGLLAGKIHPTNPHHRGNLTKAVDSIKEIAAKIHGQNR